MKQYKAFEIIQIKFLEISRKEIDETKKIQKTTNNCLMKQTIRCVY